MAGLNTLLGIGKSGLTAAQTNISTTGNNIANVNTPGYRRQSVIQEEAYPFYTTPGEIGTGVETKEVIRHFNKFIEAHYLNKSGQQEKWNALHEELRSVESLFNESNSSGISKALISMFEDWQSLSVHPDTVSARTALLGRTEALLGSIRTAAVDMANQSEQLDFELNAEVEKTNGLMREIARLNKEIQAQDIPGSRNANSLYDERDKMVRELAKKLDIHCIDNGGGNFSVITDSGQTLVEAQHHFRLSFEGPQVLENLTAGSSFDGEIAFKGDSRHEYLVKVVSGGAIGTATYKVSIDNGATWLEDENGNSVFTSSTDFFKVPGREIKLSFRPGSNPLAADDTFVVVPKKSLFWIKNASTKEHIAPFPSSSTGGDLHQRRLQGGELCGKLLHRDAYLGEYRERLDNFARSLVWQVNKIHSQGMGLKKFTDAKGTYPVDSTALTEPLNGSRADLFFGDKIKDGQCTFFVYDSAGIVRRTTVDIHQTDSLQDIVNTINNAGTGVPNLTASIEDGKLKLVTDNGYSFAFGEDSSGAMAALGLNTFFDGGRGRDISINQLIRSDLSYINSNHVNGAGEYNVGDNKIAKELAALQYQKVEFDTIGNISTKAETLQEYYDTLVGKIGADTSTANFHYKFEKALASELDARQEEIGGVNLNEEMGNLIRFQHNYSASAKLITTADKMFQTLLSLKN